MNVRGLFSTQPSVSRRPAPDPRVLDNPLGFCPYFADFADRIGNDEVIRFHRDRVALNP